MLRSRIPVVVAAPPMRVGGTEQHLLHILPALSERGFDITAVLLAAGEPLEDMLRKGIHEVVVPAVKLSRPLRTLEQARLIRSAVRRTNARVLHSFLSEPYLAAGAAHLTLWGNKPALVHGQRSLAFYSSTHRVARHVETGLHHFAGAMVGNSGAVVKELTDAVGSERKVCLIHNGIPLGSDISPREREEARRLFQIPDGAIVITLVANFHAYKGHADMLEALVLIKHKLPQPWRLLLPGRDAGTRGAVLADIEALGLAPNTVLLGAWPGSRQPYAATDIGLLVSHTEGFSNSLIEGMAAGLPMIATRVGGNIDAVDHDENGFLVDAHAPDELAAAILKLAEAPELRLRLGGAARAKALSRFSLSTCVDRYERLWRGFAEGRAGRPSEWLDDA
jgi:glycosyltransferase involved in cell wall biosynthesis